MNNLCCETLIYQNPSREIPTLGFGFADNSVNVCVKNKYERHFVRALR